MERIIELRETKELYQVGIDAAQLEHEPIMLVQDGRPIGVLISQEEYRAYQEWKDKTKSYRPSKTFLADEATFEKMLPDLVKTHKDKYVAIHEGEMVDSADTLGELAKRVYARYGYTEIYMAQVIPPRVYRIPSVWVVRQ